MRLKLGEVERVMKRIMKNHQYTKLQGLVRNKDLNGLRVTLMAHPDGSVAKPAVVATAGPRQGYFVLKACVKASGYGSKHVPVESLSCFPAAMQAKHGGDVHASPGGVLEEMLLSLFAIARPGQPPPDTLTEAECRGVISENLIDSECVLRSNMEASGLTDLRFAHEPPSVNAIDLLNASQTTAHALLHLLHELLLQAVSKGYLEVVPDEQEASPRYRLIDLPDKFRDRLASINFAPGRLHPVCAAD